ncbi:hypothetical protein GOP47_0008308 [Adiantum capillus-veneris]|uniref:BTB domain-containing protein n=1 Tax=Adiantum capillus-veneris TaxID=13818 RepID=A0A9D4UYB4_ADICA|nr:hypothetical protein GOP47_0008308 [Adiantum capillus-veneris]
MESGSPVTRTSSYSVQRPLPSLCLQKAPPQDESSEPVNQQVSEETHSVPLPKYAPPPPPPWKFSHKVVSSTGKSLQCSQVKGSSPWISEDVVEMWDRLFFEKNGADVTVYTEDGGIFLAHSIVLVSASPIFSSQIEKHHGRKQMIYRLPIRGVPLAAASMFIRLLYSSRFDVADMEKFVLHLLLLSHVYNVSFIKKLCAQELEHGLLTIENVIDVYQLTKLCDAPRLSLMCLRLIIKDFTEVAKTEGWRVMTESDPSLEQELVEAVIDADTVSWHA